MNVLRKAGEAGGAEGCLREGTFLEANSPKATQMVGFVMLGEAVTLE